MRIADPTQITLLNEVQLMLSELPLEGARLLELGCGKAEKTKTLAQQGHVKEIIALEVDTIQHEKNLAENTLPQVQFRHGGAEAIPVEDASVDVVLMFKSLHHVPIEHMKQALMEIRRVLKPGGIAWISEPVYAGDFNEILRLFHDEKTVREAAFKAIEDAVNEGNFRLQKQHFFLTRSHFNDFSEFDARMIRVTHSNHQLSASLYATVQEKFSKHMTPKGATFYNPQRVDVLRRES